MANEEHLKILNKGKVHGWNEWRKKYPEIEPDLSNANLDNEDLRKISFHKINLEGVSFINANLAHTQFISANLDNCVFTNANMRWTHFNNSSCVHAIFSNANLIDSHFRNSNLNNADFTSANCPDVNFDESQMRAACFDKANLSKASITRVDCNGASFIGANLSGAEVQVCDLDNTIMTNANLADSRISSAKFFGADLSGAIMENAHLDQAELRGVDLTTTDLTDASLYRAIIDPDKIRPGQLTKEQLQQMDFTEDIIKKLAKKDEPNKGNAYGEGKYEKGVYGGKVDADVDELNKNNNHSSGYGIVLHKDIDSGVDIDGLVAYLNSICKYIAFIKGRTNLRISDDLISHPTTHQSVLAELKEIPGDYKQMVFTERQYDDDYFYNSYGNVTIASTYGWDDLTDVPRNNGCVFFIASIIASTIDSGFRHEINTGCIYDYLVDKDGIDDCMKEADICSSCLSRIKNELPREKEPLFDDLTVILKSLSLASGQGDDILELANRMPSQSKTYTLSDFKSMLDVHAKRTFEAVINMAESPDIGLEYDITHDSYINFRQASAGRSNVVMQIHRYGNKLKTKIALVIAGIQRGIEQKEFGFSDFITKGNIEKLSGYQKGPSKEKAWLNGNTPHTSDREIATVYVVERDVSASLEDSLARVKELLLWAVGIIDKYSTEKHDKVFNTGTVATMADDKASTKDLLGRIDLVESLANVFVHSKEIEGFTVALFGNWGEGKTTVMKLLEKQLNTNHRKRFVFAKFNAWEYEKTDNIAAGLALEVVRGIRKSVNSFCHPMLFLCFMIKEHWRNFLRWLVCFIVAVLPLAAFYLFREKIGLTAGDDKNIKEFLGVGLGGGGLILAFYLFKAFKHAIEHPLSIRMQTYLKLPTYGEHLGVIPVLKRHIETLCRLTLNTVKLFNTKIGEDKRLVLFVDDLDRCQPKCIAEVLDAIRLVMENQNVIVFIGIDHRIAFKAIEQHYKDAGDGKDGRSAGEIARDYLGKIIQLPIRLQQPTSEELECFINERLFSNIDETMVTTPNTKPIETYTAVKKVDHINTHEGDDTVAKIPPPPSDDSEAPVETESPIEEITEAEMRDTKDERDEFYNMAKMLHFTNPRQLLRLRNCYRFIKAMELQKVHKVNQELDFAKMKSFMRMLFWQEFLHNRQKDLQNKCVQTLYNGDDASTINDPQTKEIVLKVKPTMLESLTNKEVYDQIAEKVNIVVLPHSYKD